VHNLNYITEIHVKFCKKNFRGALVTAAYAHAEFLTPEGHFKTSLQTELLDPEVQKKIVKVLIFIKAGESQSYVRGIQGTVNH
jgi:hypothetical protein